MPNASHHLVNASFALIATFIWVMLAGAFAWGVDSPSASTRFLAYALTGPYGIAGLLFPENMAMSMGLALQFCTCFAVVSLLRRRRIRETS